MPFTPGHRLGPYEIRSLLGAGGMGEVYEAYDTRLKRRVAIKVLAPDIAASAEYRERFAREAQALAALTHPNIVTIYSIDQVDDRVLLVMGLVEGRRLTELITDRGLPLDTLLAVALPLSDAVAAAHDKGITHRDLKPGNILVGPDGHITVLDFGLARLTDRSAPNADATTIASVHLTEQGVVAGTASYMSPEQAEGKPIDQRSDLFSLGVILYEMATGARPFRGDTTVSILSSLLRDTPESVSERRPDLPAGFANLIRRCLEKDRNRRVQTAIDVRNALEEIRSDRTAASERAPSATGRHRLAVGAIVVLVLAGLGAGWWAFAREDGSSAAVDSIAVLPFVNASGNAEIDYVASGLTETLTNTLSQVRSVRVAPRTLAAKYRGASIDPVQAGRELKVRAVVSGEVSQRGDVLRIRAELIDVNTVSQLWGEPFERPLADALGLQTNVARAIAVRLSRQLTAEEVAGLGAGTKDPVAYELYTKGEEEFSKRTASSMAHATTLFEDATVRDPSYAEAWVGLSRVYGARANIELLAPDVAYPRAIAAARKAIALDDRSAEAHATLGVPLLLYEWNWAESEREFRRAQTLDPERAEVQFMYGAFYLRFADRPDEALAELERAEALDPLTAAVPAQRAIVLAQLHRHDQAIAAAKRALAVSPSSGIARRHLAQTYRLGGKCEEAIAASKLMIDDGDPRGRSFLASAYAACNRMADARLLLKDILNDAAMTSQPVQMATLFAAMGDRDQALSWLERAYREHDPTLISLAALPEFEPLRKEARFVALRKRVGVP